MNRRQFLQSSLLGVSTALLSGCFGGATSPSRRQGQSGSGHPCENPRNIDYQAAEEYRDRGVYLRNADETVHTACVTVTMEGRTPEEAGSTPPALERTGYDVHPGMGVEIFRFAESGRYTIEVSIETATRREPFEWTETELNDDDTGVTTFEITGSASIDVTRDGDT